MDKIFKERFKNLEKKAPDYILEQLLKDISKESSSNAGVSSYTKIGIIAASIIAIIVASILLTSIPKKENIKTPYFVENNKSNKKTLPVEKPISKTVKPKNTLTQNKSVANKHSKNRHQETNNPKQENKSNNSNIIPLEKKKIETENFEISATRYTCSGECLLKINKPFVGEWFADKNVSFENKNNSESLARYSGEGKVLFTYIYQEQKDTFTVFFKHSLNFTYQITPEDCGEKNGKVEFNLPKSRQFSSANTYVLNKNTFEHLIANHYNIKIRDNYSCLYSYKLDIPIENLKAKIKYEALETRVNYPIYFSSDNSIEDVDYIWNFGDGEFAYDKNPEHKYTKPGLYSIELQLIKNNCSETMTTTIQIKDRALEIPNIFSPNNDGKNDEFIVSVPENTSSFEAYILNTKGQVIYKWTDSSLGWDGLMSNGQKAQAGTYFYIIKGKDSTNKSFEYKSILELMR